jgi:hypothetical protein
MNTLSRILALPSIFLIAALSLLNGCSSSSPQVARSWQPDATKLGIPEQELAWIALEAAKRHGGTAFDINYPGKEKNIVVVLLADKKNSRSGKMAVFKKTSDGWKEDVAAAGEWSE